MSTFSKLSRGLALALGLLAAAPLAAVGLSHKPSGVAGMDFGQDKKFKARSTDSAELREAVDETQVLVDGLARETVRQDPAVAKELLHSLRMEYKLPEAEDRARRALELGEEILRLQAGLDQLKDQRDHATEAEERERLRPKVLGTESDLMGQVEDLRKVLRSLHKDLKDEKLRDLRNWMMVSEGLLRRRREAAEEAARREAAAGELTNTASVTAPPPDGAEAQAVSPGAEAGMETPPAPAGSGPKPKSKGQARP